jgi:cellulose synthase/poly-beta-1,6-N-acetylglucosamine synthase-like glycosyltransferase
MNTTEILFWVFAAIVFYTYAGYPVILFMIVRTKRIFARIKKAIIVNDLPEITLMIPAYNERDIVESKVENTRQLNYPKEKLHQVWVTDGSDDGTPELLAGYDDVKVLHKPQRNGKIAAMNRGMKYVDTPVVVFSDANTSLSTNSLMLIAAMFNDPNIGCVSGEKRIAGNKHDSASGAGEGFYWKYESTLKKWDAEVNSAIGAAGELFAIRTVLFEEAEPDTILDDFMISLRIAMKGYKIGYNPEAYAIEAASVNVSEELKRKVRIAAGGIQSVIRLLPLLNIFKYGMLTFQYVSHRVLRWTLTPLLLPVILLLNLLLMHHTPLYSILLIAQTGFYVLALAGWSLKNRNIRLKGLFIPYYFFIMNYAVWAGIFRYAYGKQTVNWVKAVRSQVK